jgi:ribonuclease J
VFVCWSAQNIDRTVTLYRACLKTGRTLAVDLYTAEVLDILADMGRIPRAGWNNLKVVITSGFASLYRSKGREDFVQKRATHGVSAAKLAQHRGNWVVMTRPSLMRDFAAKGVLPTSDDAWCYSQWRGYLDQPDGQALASWFAAGGARARHLHTSGHASVADLRAFADAMKPRMLVPVHGAAWDSAGAGSANVVRLRDGEMVEI